MKDKVLGYVRVSTQGQVKDGYSLRYQTEEIRQYCNLHDLELLDFTRMKGFQARKSMRTN